MEGRYCTVQEGLVPLLTGLVNFCPLYTLLGLNTCPMKDKGA